MKLYKILAKKFLAEYTDTLRKVRDLTQEEMAEQLRITSRAYGNLERGKYCFSTIALLFLLLMLSDDELKTFLEGFRKRVDDLENVDLDELTAFIDEKGGNFAGPTAKAKAIQAAARNSYREQLLPVTVVNQAMAISIASIRALERQTKVLDKAIEHQFEVIPNTLTTIRGIGKVYSAGIIAEIGNIHRFESQAFGAKYAGLVWNRNQFGDFGAEHTRLIKSGNHYLRYCLLEAANSVRKYDSEFQRYYDLKFHEVSKFQHKRALALPARKLVRLVFQLLKEKRLYIPLEG